MIGTAMSFNKKVTRFNSHLPFDKLPGVGEDSKWKFLKLLDAWKI